MAGALYTDVGHHANENKMISQLRKLYKQYFCRDSNPPSSKEIPDTIANSISVAKTCQNEEILPDHLIMAIIGLEYHTAAGDYLKKCKDYKLIKKYLFDRCLEKKVESYKERPFTSLSEETKEALEGTEKVAQELGSEKLRAEHILLSILKIHKYPFPELGYERVKMYFINKEK